MVTSCCSYGCKERFVKGGSITFHSFPKDENQRKLWINALRRYKFVPNTSTRICSKHFENDCFDEEKFGGRWLKKNAVPTIFSFPARLHNRSKLQRPQRERVLPTHTSASPVDTKPQKKTLLTSHTSESLKNIRPTRTKLLADNTTATPIDSMSQRKKLLIHYTSALSVDMKLPRKKLLADHTSVMPIDNKTRIQLLADHTQASPIDNSDIPSTSSLVEPAISEPMVAAIVQPATPIDNKQSRIHFLADHTYPASPVDNRNMLNTSPQVESIILTPITASLPPQSTPMAAPQSPPSVPVAVALPSPSIPITTAVSLLPPNKRCKRFRYVGDFTEEVLSSHSETRKCLTIAMKKVQQQKKKLKFLTQKNRRLKEKVETLKSLVLLNKKSVGAPEDMLQLTVSGTAAELLKRTEKGASREEYPPELRSFALTLYYCSSRAYDFVRKTLNTALPHPKTLKKWCKSFDGKPEVTSEALLAPSKDCSMLTAEGNCTPLSTNCSKEFTAEALCVLPSIDCSKESAIEEKSAPSSIDCLKEVVAVVLSEPSSIKCTKHGTVDTLSVPAEALSAP
ncbi:THAP domain-containing protein 5-like [Procambarus clarkii]|uniref:THAP domain-containing protein 5-like n=1 Tax=Procambarus clarkii TaxID=6728 RepID=UPI0037438D0D